MKLDVLAEAIDQLAGSDPSAWADAESIEVLQTQLARLDAVVTRAVAAFDASGAWAPDGARNATAWLATRCRLPKGLARRQVRRGRHLADLPACGAAWSAGDITGAHVDAIAALSRPATREALDRDEDMLVAQASTLEYDPFARALSYWEQLADPDGTEESAEERRVRRDVYLAASFGGMWLGGITLDPISGAIVSKELERIERRLFEVDWAEAATALGCEPTSADLCRSPGQRRADALVEMATRSGTAPSNGRRPSPLFSVLVGFETLHGRICQLAEGTVVSPGSLLPWLDQAVIERAVFGPTSRVEIATTSRLFTGATRRGIELRDRGCVHPYCDRPMDDCEVDHIVPYGAGGLTTQENGRLLCGFHNRLRNERPPPTG